METHKNYKVLRFQTGTRYSLSQLCFPEPMFRLEGADKEQEEQESKGVNYSMVVGRLDVTECLDQSKQAV